MRCFDAFLQILTVRKLKTKKNNTTRSHTKVIKWREVSGKVAKKVIRTGPSAFLTFFCIWGRILASIMVACFCSGLSDFGPVDSIFRETLRNCTLVAH